MKQFNVPNIYRSDLISAVKNQRRLADKLKKDFSPTLLDLGPLQIYLARHFGFCYGVENAIEIAFNTIHQNPGKRIFLLSEMIHNPQVNADLQERGVQFMQDTYGNQLIPFSELTPEDIVIIPAFGTTRQVEQLLQERGVQTEKYNTTCPFVEKVWNRSEQIARKGYSIVVHGKPKHEETRATFSHASAHTPTIVVNDMAEAVLLARYILDLEPADSFYETFKGRYSEGFNVQRDLQRIGVVNQTTQLASDTQAISDYLKNVMVRKYALDADTIGNHFADTRDTLCYATNDNQTAVTGMLGTRADVAIVVGGYNSSNTSHLVEICESVLPTYFINSAEKLISPSEILRCNWRTREETLQQDYLPETTPVKILVTSGASCPDAVVESVIRRLASFYDRENRVDLLVQEFAAQEI
jgi:4-hydroxy-3-methylbut-2-enyl diphosphate reductase